MAKYTVELRSLVAQGYPLALDTYPIFNEDYRPILNQKIISHYWFREIGQETPDRFNHYLSMKLHEVMPYYNKLYESELYKYNPLETDYFEEQSRGFKDTEVEQKASTSRKAGETTGDVYTGVADTGVAFDRSYTTKETGSGTHAVDHTLDNTYRKGGDRTAEADTTGSVVDKTTENTTSSSTTTNDLTASTDTTSTGEGTSHTTGTVNKAFSDVPQGGITTSMNVNPNGSITVNNTGYMTTINLDNSIEDNATTSKEDSNGTTRNTGTVDVSASANKVTDYTSATTGHELAKELWNESGSSKDTYAENGNTTSLGEGNGTEHTDTHTLSKEDTERNVARNERVSQKEKGFTHSQDDTLSNTRFAGRRGYSPAELIQTYRDSLINIDMMVIESLTPLFMEVF